MQGNTLQGMRVAMIVSDDFEQAKFTEPKKALEQAGAKVTVVAPKAGQVTGMNHDVKADTFNVDMTLDAANPSDFDALMLPGGALNARCLAHDAGRQQFVKDFDSKGKPIAFICHAPWLLVSAGLVKGRTMTSWASIQDDLRNAGANWVDQEMVQDRNWVDAGRPKDLGAFNPAMVQLFASSKVGAKQ